MIRDTVGLSGVSVSVDEEFLLHAPPVKRIGECDWFSAA